MYLNSSRTGCANVVPEGPSSYAVPGTTPAGDGGLAIGVTVIATGAVRAPGGIVTVAWPPLATMVPPLAPMRPPSRTVMVADAPLPSLVAVTTVMPDERAVTRPSFVTVAMAGALETQDTLRPVSVAPLAASVVAVTWAVCCATRVAVSRLSWTVATAAGGGGGGGGGVTVPPESPPPPHERTVAVARTGARRRSR